MPYFSGMRSEDYRPLGDIAAANQQHFTRGNAVESTNMSLDLCQLVAMLQLAIKRRRTFVVRSYMYVVRQTQNCAVFITAPSMAHPAMRRVRICLL